MEIKKNKIVLNLSHEEKECITNMIKFTNDFRETANCFNNNNFDCCDCPLQNFCGYTAYTFIEELDYFLNNNM